MKDRFLFKYIKYMASFLLNIVSSGGMVVRNLKCGIVYGAQAPEEEEISWSSLRTCGLAFSGLAPFMR